MAAGAARVVVVVVVLIVVVVVFAQHVRRQPFDKEAQEAQKVVPKRLRIGGGRVAVERA